MLCAGPQASVDHNDAFILDDIAGGLLGNEGGSWVAPDFFGQGPENEAMPSYHHDANETRLFGELFVG